jgi:hypothetical protein
VGVVRQHKVGNVPPSKADRLAGLKRDALAGLRAGLDVEVDLCSI